MSTFAKRHIGISSKDSSEMLSVLGFENEQSFIDAIIPKHIQEDFKQEIPFCSEQELLNLLSTLAEKNDTGRSFIGMGYYNTYMPEVIKRNVFENPGWYTQYTPYQAEIAQGRLEALLNFQTMVSDLTALPLANASLLDESTAAAEAMIMTYHAKNKRAKAGQEINKFLVDKNIFPQTIDVLRGRADALNIELVIDEVYAEKIDETYFACIVQYPNTFGEVNDYKLLGAKTSELNISLICIADILGLSLLTPPGEWGANICVGSTQRFGVPMGNGGPHAAYFSCDNSFKRQIPGRIIGVSEDRHGKKALRMALQTREQHIKREKATSNICTAQALLAIIASHYAVYHGGTGIKRIAQRTHDLTKKLGYELDQLGYDLVSKNFFDTIAIKGSADIQMKIKSAAEYNNLFFNYFVEDHILISLDETSLESDVDAILDIFRAIQNLEPRTSKLEDFHIPSYADRTSKFLTHKIFNTHRSETSLMRYLKYLENKDFSLVHGMIPLGSCTMKLNAAVQLAPLSWASFGNIHPFAPAFSKQGYQVIINELSDFLCQITGMTACSLMPNSGAQGELTGLRVIDAYHKNNSSDRDIVIIPASAHGTNPASAIMAGMKVKVVKCDEKGNIDLVHLAEVIAEYKAHISALMVTYPSTHGVYEEEILAMTNMIHESGGLVYMDGANMNAQVGYTSPGKIGADVCHLNLHKTFAIPHGGGGPGMGPICCNGKLAPFLPTHFMLDTKEDQIDPVASAPFSSALILIISYAYIKLLGSEGMKKSTYAAMLSSNYMMKKLAPFYDTLYVGKQGFCAHEFIIDLRHLKQHGLSAEDVAKRLIDYGFHAPTLSFPVAGTLMVEPTESETKKEIDLFLDAMISIHGEIQEIIESKYDKDNNVLVNSPHTLNEITHDEWTHVYPRSKAAYPLDSLRSEHKFWPTVGRINQAKGDKNLICTCPPIEEYE